MNRSLENELELLHQAALYGEISRSAVEIARFAKRLWQKSAPLNEKDTQKALGYMMFTGIILTSALENGHTCVKLSKDGLRQIVEGFASERVIGALSNLGVDIPYSSDHNNLGKWHYLSKEFIQFLESSFLVGQKGQDKPFVLDGQRLYFHRYWSYEKRLSELLLKMACQIPPFFEDNFKKAIEAGLATVKRLFPENEDKGPNWQQLAAASSLFSRFLVVTGGPGTGKTWTVTAIMAVLQAAATKIGPPLEIALCAPTGKAASRLSESIMNAKSSLSLDPNLKELIPSGACTIHRLLGHGLVPGKFKYGPSRSIPHQVIILDEASMVDLPLMIHLIEALGKDTSLILLGDKDQLASVEPGSVLRDICIGLELFDYSKRFWDMAKLAKKGLDEDVNLDAIKQVDSKQQRLADSLIVLKDTFRFKEKSGLSELASAINSGQLNLVFDIVDSSKFEDVSFISSSEKSLPELVGELANKYLSDLKDAKTPLEAMKIGGKFKILCGLKRKSAGVESLNRLMDYIAINELGLGPARGGFFKGKPIVISKNDYYLELFNGDMGICWPNEHGTMAIWFEGADGNPRSFKQARLPFSEPAWALTVHKSQGSEFDVVLVVLPPSESAMPGRELLYTAVTRAKKKVIIYGSREDLSACVINRVVRHSGLGEYLWG